MLCLPILLLFCQLLYTTAVATDDNAQQQIRDQYELDALATTIDQQSPYNDLKQLVRQQFSSTVETLGYSTDSDYMQHQLQTAVQELAFGFLQQAVNSDPAHPKVYRIVTPRHDGQRSTPVVPGGRFGFDNPDCIYRIIPVSDAFSYVVQGKGHEVPASDITISLHSSFTGSTIALLSGKDIVRDEQHRFRISVTASNSSFSSAPNHIQSTPESKLLLIRHNIGDWLAETPDELVVQVTGKPENAISDYKGVSNEVIIETARQDLQKNIFIANFLLGKLTLSASVNTIISPSQSTKMGLATQALVLSHYNLGPSDALVVTIEAGPSTYWNLGVFSLWMVTENARNRLETLNNHQAIANRNGSYTFVLSATDPNVFNWLNTSSQGLGTIVTRFQGLPADGSALSAIHIWSQTARLEDLHLSLPPDTTYISATRRARQLEIRAAGYDRLYSFRHPFLRPTRNHAQDQEPVSCFAVPIEGMDVEHCCSVME